MVFYVLGSIESFIVENYRVGAIGRETSPNTYTTITILYPWFVIERTL